ncbi:ribonucleoside-diphosphate reductase subunit beta [Terrihabitans soli]|uniref:ribonucleoside-diphosphate reductase n=1 Tax=Terrihabitans soli TaxID=708113 RepID=A0A6S6QYS9_9HYPH|nr:ribonucleotide-diphosphate reductase subunit beta [Terrihabitans soli]BCJ91748.1 ribonucleoside-diphosphate reductase subunit beta [Terrihabitans soli]
MPVDNTSRPRLFDHQVARKPNYYPWTESIKEAMWHNPWTAFKFKFDTDVTDFRLNLSDEERQVIVRCLAAIAQIEVAVKTFWSRLGDNLPHPSIAGLGTVMAGIEEIHNHAYERLLDKLGLDDIQAGLLDVPAIAGRVSYLNKHNTKVYGDDRKQYIYSLILFTLFVENVSLFSQFYIILWFNRFENRLKDAAQQVKYTRNEELLHALAGMKIINTLREEYPELFDEDLEAKICEETEVAFQAEAALIDWMVGDYDRPRLNASLLKSYVAQRLNESLIGIGYAPQFDVSEEDKQATFWMTEGLLAPPKVDFFHSEPTGYSEGDMPVDDDF